jgi:hypothetical protein
MSIFIDVLFDRTPPDADREYEIRKQAYKEVFSTPDGKIVLKDLLQTTRFNDASITDSCALNAYQAGLRAVAMRILEMLESKNSEETGD